MKQLTIPEENVGYHRLLGGWRDVRDDIRLLCRQLAELPDECRCGHGAAHLQGACPCCRTVATDRVPNCGDCDALLAQLRPVMDGLSVDTFRFFPFVKELLARENAPAFEQAMAIEGHIAALVSSFGQVVVAAGRFRNDCRASHLKELKDFAAALRRDADALDRVA